MPRQSSIGCGSGTISEETDRAARWTILKETEILRIGDRLTVSQQHLRLPDGREVTDYLRVETLPFVCIFALTPEGGVICERQYKHGVGRVILSLPAGAIERGEEPVAAARRELLEETGYFSEEWQFLSAFVTHANAQGSLCHAFLARNSRKIAEPASGDLEDMTVEVMSEKRMLRALAEGQMPLGSDPSTVLHALMVLGRL